MRFATESRNLPHRRCTKRKIETGIRCPREEEQCRLERVLAEYWEMWFRRAYISALKVQYLFTREDENVTRRGWKFHQVCSPSTTASRFHGGTDLEALTENCKPCALPRYRFSPDISTLEEIWSVIDCKSESLSGTASGSGTSLLSIPSAGTHSSPSTTPLVRTT